MKRIFEYVIIVILAVVISGLFIVRQEEIFVDDVVVYDQLLDNRTDFSAYTIDVPYNIIGDYIEILPQYTGYQYAYVPIIITGSTQYTLIYKVDFNNTNTAFRLGEDSWFDNEVIDASVGYHTKLLTSKNSTSYEVIRFELGTVSYAYKLRFRPILLEGDFTGLSNNDIEDLMFNAEYGDYEIDNSYSYMVDISVEDRVTSIIPILSSLILVSVLGYIGFNILKKS